MKQEQNKYINIYKASFFGALFLVLYIPFNVCQNIMTVILSDTGFSSLGFKLLAVIYLFQMIGSVLAPSICSKIGLKWSLFFGGLTLSFVNFSLISPAYYSQQNPNNDDTQDQTNFFLNRYVVIVILYIGNIIVGFGAALLWVAQGEYVSNCASEQTKGFYFGHFWALYMSAQIFGNLTGALLISKTSGIWFFLIMGIIMLIPVFGFLFIRKPLITTNPQENNEIKSLNQQHQTFYQQMQNTIFLIFTRKMMYLNLQIFYSGISISYFSGLLGPIISQQLINDPKYNQNISDKDKDSKVLFALIALGFGEVIGGLLLGLIIDKIGSKKTSLINLSVILILIAVTILSINSERYNWLTYLMCFLWGFQDGSINIHSFQILGFEFESQSEPFGVFNLVQGISVFIFQLIQSYLDTSNNQLVIIYTLIVGFIAATSHLITYFFPYTNMSINKKTMDKRKLLVQRFTQDSKMLTESS